MGATSSKLNVAPDGVKAAPDCLGKQRLSLYEQYNSLAGFPGLAGTCLVQCVIGARVTAVLQFRALSA
jgi:hypothetical protein